MKIVIIGAGPIGCYTARLLKEKGSDFDIEIIEEHSEIGRPIHCAGLVSKEVLSEIKFPLSEDVVVNRIDGAEFFLDDDSFKMDRKDVALVIDREKFDRVLGNGLKVNFNTRFVGIEKNGAGYLVETDKGEYYADIVIGADGANSTLRKIGEFKEDIEYLRGVQFRIKYGKCNRNFVRVYLQNPYFAWVIPEIEDIVRVGIISHNPYHDLLGFLKEKSIEEDILEKFAGTVPLGKCSTQNGNLFLVGDAACQIKPLTYGGIYYGMRCAEMLVDCILQNRLGEYEREWKQKFEREIDIGLKLKRMYERLSQDEAEKLFAILKNNVSIIEKFGDFENHSKVISMIIKDPRLQILLGKVFISFLKGCLYITQEKNDVWNRGNI